MVPYFFFIQLRYLFTVEILTSDLFDTKFQCFSTQVNILETVHWLMKLFLLLQTIRIRYVGWF